MRERQVQLRMADFVEHAVDTQVAPTRGGCKAAEAALHGDRHLLNTAGCTHVQNGRIDMARIELFKDVGALESVANRVGARLFFTLNAHVFAVGDAVWFVPVGPGFLGYRSTTGPGLGKRVLLVHVGKRPIDIACNVVPIITAKYSHFCLHLF